MMPVSKILVFLIITAATISTSSQARTRGIGNSVEYRDPHCLNRLGFEMQNQFSNLFRQFHASGSNTGQMAKLAGKYVSERAELQAIYGENIGEESSISLVGSISISYRPLIDGVENTTYNILANLCVTENCCYT